MGMAPRSSPQAFLILVAKLVVESAQWFVWEYRGEEESQLYIFAAIHLDLMFQSQRPNPPRALFRWALEADIFLELLDPHKNFLEASTRREADEGEKGSMNIK